MKCYICGEEMFRWQTHAGKLHPEHYKMFQWWYGSDRVPLMYETPQQRYKGSGKAEVKALFMNGDFEVCIDCEKKRWTNTLLDVSWLPEVEKQGYPQVKPVKSEYVSLDTFGNFAKYLVAIRKITDLDQFTFDISARIGCFQCANYGRGRHCPPNIRPLYFYRKWVQKWDGCYVFIYQSNGLAGWDSRPEGTILRWGVGMKGVDKGMSVSAMRALGAVAGILQKRGFGCVISPPGPCKLCGSYCVASGKGVCRHPLPIYHTLEAMGIDVIRLVLGLGIPIQQPCFDFVTKCGVVFYKKR